MEWTNPALERRQLLSKPTAREYASGAALMRAFQLKRGQSRVPRESFPVHSSVGLAFSPACPANVLFRSGFSAYARPEQPCLRMSTLSFTASGECRAAHGSPTWQPSEHNADWPAACMHACPAPLCRYGQRLDAAERKRKKEAREVHKRSEFARKAIGTLGMRPQSSGPSMLRFVRPHDPCTGFAIPHSQV